MLSSEHGRGDLYTPLLLHKLKEVWLWTGGERDTKMIWAASYIVSLVF